MVSADETVYTYLFDGGWENAAHRVFRNSTVAEWELAGQPARGSRPREAEHIGHTKSGKEILSYEDTPPLRDMEGDWERCALYAGESVGVIHKIQSARTSFERSRGMRLRWSGNLPKFSLKSRESTDY